jgi:hypothetical protein
MYDISRLRVKECTIFHASLFFCSVSLVICIGIQIEVHFWRIPVMMLCV